jgi:sporulation protein YqfC
LRKLSDLLVKKMDIPIESIIGMPQISICGDAQVTVEGFKKVLEYSDTIIVIGYGKGMIEILGAELCIKSFTKNLILIMGKIFSVGFRE